jgi:hypothetical protein
MAIVQALDALAIETVVTTPVIFASLLFGTLDAGVALEIHIAEKVMRAVIVASPTRLPAKGAVAFLAELTPHLFAVEEAPAGHAAATSAERSIHRKFAVLIIGAPARQTFEARGIGWLAPAPGAGGGLAAEPATPLGTSCASRLAG